MDRVLEDNKKDKELGTKLEESISNFNYLISNQLANKVDQIIDLITGLDQIASRLNGSNFPKNSEDKDPNPTDWKLISSIKRQESDNSGLIKKLEDSQADLSDLINRIDTSVISELIITLGFLRRHI